VRQVQKKLPVGRYPRTYSINWSDRVVFTNEDLIIVDKPHGVPVSYFMENEVETVVHQLRKNHLGLFLPLRRLSVGTSGLLVGARNPSRYLETRAQLRQGNMRRTFAVACQHHVPVGEVKHMCRPRGHCERQDLCRDYMVLPWSQHDRSDGWTDMHMIVRETRCIEENLYECQVELKDVTLKTGATSQIRLQMGAIGSAIIGDSGCIVTPQASQGGAPTGTRIEIGLDPLAIGVRISRIEFEWNGRLEEVRAPPQDWHAELEAARVHG